MRFLSVAAGVLLLLCCGPQALAENEGGSTSIRQQAQVVFQEAQTALQQEDELHAATSTAEREANAAAIDELRNRGADSREFVRLRREYRKRVSDENRRHYLRVKSLRSEAQQKLAVLNNQYRFASAQEQLLAQRRLAAARYANSLAWATAMQRAYGLHYHWGSAYQPRDVIPVPGGYVVRRGPGWWQYPVWPYHCW